MSDVDERGAGTFLVTSVDEAALVLQNVATAQVHTVATDDVEAPLEGAAIDDAAVTDAGPVRPESILDDTVLAPAGADVLSTVESVGAVRWIPIDRVDLEPTKRSRETAAAAGVGSLTTHERAGEGSVHVLGVPPESLESAASDVVADPATRRRAARQSVDRVEIRTGEMDPESETGDEVAAGTDIGVLSVRYLPN